MALTEFQRTVCRLLAANRIERGESYVAGGTALNLLTGGARISRDIDIFHDTNAALAAAARAWHAMLTEAREIVGLLPADEAGKCVLDRRGLLYAGPPDRLHADLAAGALVFHEGSIRGAFPVLA